MKLVYGAFRADCVFLEDPTPGGLSVQVFEKPADVDHRRPGPFAALIVESVNQHDALKAHIAELERKNEASTKWINELHDEIASLTRNANKLTVTNDNLNASLDSYREHLGKAQNRIEELRNSLDAEIKLNSRKGIAHP